MYIDPVRYEGRPGNVSGRLEKEQRCYALLDKLQISYARVDHEHADTIEACEAVEQVLGEKICKNLFLCNRQKTQFYLLMLEGEKVFKTKDLSKQLGVARLSFADPADMKTPFSLYSTSQSPNPPASAATRASTPRRWPFPRRTS